MKLSVVIPVYNERATLWQVVERVLAVPLELEIVCVDDGSRDGSREILAELQRNYPAGPGLSTAAEHGQRSGAAAWNSASHGRLRSDPGCRSGIRSMRTIRCFWIR